LFFIKKNYKFFILILVLLIILFYAVNITSISESIILLENEKLDINPIFGIKTEETIEVDANIGNKINSQLENQTSKKQYNLSLLGFNLKTITANIIPKIKVIPLGELVGLKLNTKGILVVGVSQIKGEDNKIYKPYEDAGIKPGDTILEINAQTVETTEELISCVSRCKGESIKVKYIKNGKTLNTQINPVKTDESTYKIGLWVRDTAAGVGTLSFYEPETNSIAALGHGIHDVDTGEIVEIQSGEFVTSEIINIEKGEQNSPGKIEGTIQNSQKIGEIYTNTNFGIYGKINNVQKLNINNKQPIEVALRNEIKVGKANVLCTLEDGKKQEFEVEIQKIYINNNENNKSMIIKVIDKELIEKTGGIIQGMSGAPIIQNGKLIGALTHVLVQKPDTGYAVFADLMIKQMRTVE